MTVPGRRAAHPRRAFYGIAEIADAAELSRQLVTVWRRRRSHGMPEPDAELSSGPIWRGETIEPWIDRVRAERGRADAPPLDRAIALRACRRALRLAAVLLERPVRVRLLSQALSELRELRPDVSASADDELGRAARTLLTPLAGLEFDTVGTDANGRLRDRVLETLPVVREIVRLVD